MTRKPAEQLQHAGLDAVVGGEAADQHGRDAAGLQNSMSPVLRAPRGRDSRRHRVQIRLDPFQTKKS